MPPLPDGAGPEPGLALGADLRSAVSVRWIAIAGGLLLSILLAAAAAAWIWRVEVAETVLRYGAARAGVGEASFRVETIDLDGMRLVEIRVGESFRAEELEVAFDLGRLPDPPVERVRVVGAELDVDDRPDGAGSVTPDGEIVEEAGGGALPLALLPVLEIERGRIRLPSDAGPVVLRLDSRVEPRPGFVEMTLSGVVEGGAASARLEGRARLDEAGPVSIRMDVAAIDLRDPSLRVAGGEASLQLTGRADGLELERAEGSVELDLADVRSGGSIVGDVTASLPFTLVRRDEHWVATLSHARVRLPGQGLDAKAISGEVSLDGVDLTVDRLLDTARERRFEPLSVRLRVPQTGPEVPFSVEVAAAAGRASMRAFGRYEAETRTLRAEVLWPRFELDPETLRPRDLSPLLRFGGSVAGALDGRALLTWTPADGLEGTATVSVADGRLVTTPVRIEGLSGRVVLESFAPLATRGVQHLRASEIHPGVSLTDAKAEIALEPAANGRGSRLLVGRFECRFAGGVIVVEDARLDPAAPENEIAFRFDGLDVADLFAIAAIEGVSGSGEVSGRLPVAVRDGALAVHGGRLASTDGVLRVRSESVRGLLAGAGDSAELLLRALRDFHYDSLEVTIEKELAGETEIALHLAGSNPAVLDGHPFRVNLNLTGNLEHVVRSLLEVARLSDRAVRATVGAALEDDDE